MCQRFSYLIQLLGSLHILLTLPPASQPYLLTTHKQIANAIAELIQLQAGVLKSHHDWLMLIFLLENIGTGMILPPSSPPWSPLFGREADNSLVTTQTSSGTHTDSSISIETSPALFPALSRTQESINHHFLSTLNMFDLLVEETIQPHEPDIFFKCCKTLSDLVRSDVHVTAANFSLCVHCIRTFSEVSSCELAMEYEASMGWLVCCVYVVQLAVPSAVLYININS